MATQCPCYEWHNPVRVCRISHCRCQIFVNFNHQNSFILARDLKLKLKQWLFFLVITTSIWLKKHLGTISTKLHVQSMFFCVHFQWSCSACQMFNQCYKHSLPDNYYHPRMWVGNVFSHVCLSVCLSVCVSVCLSVCVSVCLCFCLFRL